MDFLDKLVIPLSGEHLQLLHYLLMLILFLFIPFISLVFAGTLLSLVYRNRGVNNNDPQSLRLSKDIIETTTINKGIGIILGVVPLITSILLMAQIMHNTHVTVINYLFISLLLIFFALIFIYSYRYSLTFNEMFTALKNVRIEDKNIETTIDKYRENSRKLSVKTGIVGFVFLIFGVWFFIAAITMATFPSGSWETPNFVSTLLQWQVVTRFIYFILAAFAFTGATILFIYFYWEGGRKDLSNEYKEFIKSAAIRITFTSSLLIPLFLVVNLLGLPDRAYSGTVFGLTILSLFLLFLAYHFIYSMMKFLNQKYVIHVFVVILAVLLSVIVKDQVAISNTNELQTEILTANFENMMQKLNVVNKPKTISGKQVFQNICSACHAFDHKVVGPPYEQTLPKYEGKMDQLVKFILNPTQNNPGYPPMPNPGLKPNEAKAVAKYIMDTYLKKYKNE
jgi:cytochrome c